MIRKAVTPLALAAMLGLAACGGEEVEGDAEVTREVITEEDTRTMEVEVPVVDTAVVERRVDIDTAVSVDTIDDPERQSREQIDIQNPNQQYR